MLLDKKIPFLYILGSIKHDLLQVMVISIMIYYVTLEYREAIPPIPVALPAFLGTAISLLLSFKLNQSYERWWEARKLWGAIVNDSRMFVIQLRAFVKPDNHSVVKTIAFRQIAWAYALGQALRGLPAEEKISQFLSEKDLETLKQHQNKPLAILDLHAQDISGLLRTGKLELFHHIQLDQTIMKLCDSMGGAERINKTVFPVTYRLFLHFFTYVFITILSISIAEIDGIFEIPLLVSIAVPFFLLEKAASHLQDPFTNKPTDTPVTAIANTIEINIKQLLSEADVPAPAEAEEFYLN